MIVLLRHQQVSDSDRNDTKMNFGLVILRSSHKPMVRGSIPVLTFYFHPWGMCFTFISFIHLALFKTGPGHEGSSPVFSRGVDVGF